MTYKDAFGAHDIAHHLGNVAKQLSGRIAVIGNIWELPGQSSSVPRIDSHEKHAADQRGAEGGKDSTHLVQEKHD